MAWSNVILSKHRYIKQELALLLPPLELRFIQSIEARKNKIIQIEKHIFFSNTQI